MRRLTPTRMSTSHSSMNHEREAKGGSRIENEPAIDSGGGFVRLRLDIAYDGTEFAGWAVQSGQRTVAGTLDDALSTVFRVPVQLRAAGRTDAGVHATGQVAHVDVPADALAHAYPRTARAGDNEFLPLVRRLARFLPADVRVLDIGRAAAGFDARFSALRRHYVYRLSTAPHGVEPQDARYVTAWPRRLDVDAMTTASRDLLGLHDFAAFCRHREGATTIRELQRQDAHANQITPVDSLKACRNYRFDSKQPRSFRRPVAARTGAVFVTGNDHQRNLFLLVTLRCVVYGHLLATRIMDRDTAFDTGNHQVLDSHIGKGSARHYAIIAAPAAVAIKINRLHTALNQVTPSG